MEVLKGRTAGGAPLSTLETGSGGRCSCAVLSPGRGVPSGVFVFLAHEGSLVCRLAGAVEPNRWQDALDAEPGLLGRGPDIGLVAVE
jgi:hypothetical protein